MLFHFNVCLEKSDNIYFSCPADYKVTSNWDEIIKMAENKFEATSLDEKTILFSSKEQIEKFMVFFTCLYANIQFDSSLLEARI